jgi:hypothetical protein
MEKIVYLLCALTAAICAGLLWRSYRQTRHRLLYWSGLCFTGLALNNVILLLDKIVFLEIDLTTLRLASALAALLLLLFGLVWEEQ